MDGAQILAERTPRNLSATAPVAGLDLEHERVVCRDTDTRDVAVARISPDIECVRRSKFVRNNFCADSGARFARRGWDGALVDIGLEGAAESTRQRTLAYGASLCGLLAFSRNRVGCVTRFFFLFGLI